MSMDKFGSSGPKIRVSLSRASDGLPITGLSNTSAGLVITAIADTEASAAVYDAASSKIETIATVGTYAAPSSGKCRFKEVDATNDAGLYEIQLEAVRYAVAGSKSAIVHIKGAADLAPCRKEVALSPFVDIHMVSSDDVAADNLEATFDGTGYANTNAPATQGGITDIKGSGWAATDSLKDIKAAVVAIPASLGVPIAHYFDSTAGDSITIITGGTPVGNVSSVNAEDGTFYQVPEVNNATPPLDIRIKKITSPIGQNPAKCTIVSYYGFTGGQITTTHWVDIYAWDYLNSVWQYKSTMQMRTSTQSSFRYEFGLAARNQKSATDGNGQEGEMLIRLVHNSVTGSTNHSMFIDNVKWEKNATDNAMASDIANILAKTNQINITNGLVDAIPKSLGYANGAVWVNTTGGYSGTQSYINGTLSKPSSTLADAVTIMTALGMSRLEFMPKSNVTLATAMAGKVLTGSMWMLDLGGQEVGDSLIQNCEMITGTAVKGAGNLEYVIRNSRLGAISSQEVDVYDSIITDVFTLTEATSYLFDKCWAVPLGTPTLDFGSVVGGSAVVMTKWSGELTIKNLKAGDTLLIDGKGNIIMDVSCSGGTLVLRGEFPTPTVRAGVTYSLFLTSKMGDEMALTDDQITALQNVTVGGYAEGQDPATLLFITPANKLATDEEGRVTPILNPDLPLNPTTLTFTDGGEPVVGLQWQIWLNDKLVKLGSTDMAGESNAGGLIAGGYTLRAFMVGYIAIDQPITIIEGGDIQNVELQAIPHSDQPPFPSTSLLYGYALDIEGNPVSNAVVTVVHEGEIPTELVGTYVGRKVVRAKTDVNGFFELAIVKNIPIRIQCADVKFEKTTVLTGASTNWVDI